MKFMILKVNNFHKIISARVGDFDSWGSVETLRGYTEGRRRVAFGTIVLIIVSYLARTFQRLRPTTVNDLSCKVRFIIPSDLAILRITACILSLNSERKFIFTSFAAYLRTGWLRSWKVLEIFSEKKIVLDFFQSSDVLEMFLKKIIHDTFC